MLGAANHLRIVPSQRVGTYGPVLSRVRFLLVSKMAKPEEVLVVENENGEAVREFMKDTDAIELYKLMRATLGAGTCHLLIHSFLQCTSRTWTASIRSASCRRSCRSR